MAGGVHCDVQEHFAVRHARGPAGLPQTVIDRLDRAGRRAMADPATIKFLEGNAAIPAQDTTPVLTRRPRRSP